VSWITLQLEPDPAREKLTYQLSVAQGYSDEVGDPVLQRNLTAKIAFPTLALFLISEKAARS
jgi:hypothetical protein